MSLEDAIKANTAAIDKFILALPAFIAAVNAKVAEMAPAEAPPEPKKEAPKKEALKLVEPEVIEDDPLEGLDDLELEEVQPTFQDVTTEFRKVAVADKSKALALLKQFSVAKLSELESKPEQFSKFITACKAA